MTASRGGGRLTLMVQRDGVDHAAWAGAWQVMVGYHDPAMDGMVMVELHSSPNQPIAPKETASIAKAYLQKQGVALRA